MSQIIDDRRARERQLSAAEEALKMLQDVDDQKSEKWGRSVGNVQKAVVVIAVIWTIAVHSTAPIFLGLIILFYLWIIAPAPQSTPELNHQRKIVENLKAEHGRIEDQFSRQINEHNFKVLNDVQLEIQKLRNLGDLDPSEFEDKVAELFRRNGYNVQQTPYSVDGGKDAILERDGKRAYLECKRYKPQNPIGRPVLQRLKGAMSADGIDHGFFVTSGRFSEPAREFAEANNIRLCDGEWVLRNFVKAGFVAVEARISEFKLLCSSCGDEVRFRFPAQIDSETCSCGSIVSAKIPVWMSVQAVRSTSRKGWPRRTRFKRG